MTHERFINLDNSNVEKIHSDLVVDSNPSTRNNSDLETFDGNHMIE